MKKILTVVTALSVLALCVSCGGKSKEEKAADAFADAMKSASKTYSDAVKDINLDDATNALKSANEALKAYGSSASDALKAANEAAKAYGSDASDAVKAANDALKAYGSYGF